MTSAARVQLRSDVDGSWSRPTSFLRDRRGFPVSSVDFLGRHRRRPVLVSGVHANFLTHVSAKAASTALTCEDCGVRFISRLKYKIQAWRHVYDNLCIRLSLALVEGVLKKLALGKYGVAAHHAISDGIVYEGEWHDAVPGRPLLLLLT